MFIFTSWSFNLVDLVGVRETRLGSLKLNCCMVLGLVPLELGLGLVRVVESGNREVRMGMKIGMGLEKGRGIGRKCAWLLMCMIETSW